MISAAGRERVTIVLKTIALIRPKDKDLLIGVLRAFSGLPWALRRRRALPREYDRWLRVSIAIVEPRPTCIELTPALRTDASEDAFEWEDFGRER